MGNLHPVRGVLPEPVGILPRLCQPANLCRQGVYALASICRHVRNYGRFFEAPDDQIEGGKGSGMNIDIFWVR